jgi:hypothetical protein
MCCVKKSLPDSYGHLTSASTHSHALFQHIPPYLALFGHSPQGDKVKVATAVAPFTLTFNKAGDAVTVTDTQGNVAKVMKANLGSANHQVHVVDKVLYSGACGCSTAYMVGSQAPAAHTSILSCSRSVLSPCFVA